METITLSQLTGLTEGYAASQGSVLDTGDLRRAYNFGNMVSALKIKQDPFFRLASVFRKVPTDDPQFKFAESRPSFHRRYAYVVGHSTDGINYTTNNATVTATNIEVGDTWYVQMKTDYKSDGNIGNIYDATGSGRSSAINVGATGTRPRFFLANQLIKIPFGSAYNAPNDYIIGRIEEVTNGTEEDVILKLKIVRTLRSPSNNVLQWASATAPMSTTYNLPNATRIENLESKKSYVVGTAFLPGSGYPETWFDTPYSTGYGLTQIFKTAMSMDNTTRATVLKYSPNEWARIWGEKLVEHKWDIEHTMFFGKQGIDADGFQYTQGVVDYALSYGNIFTLDHATKTVDDFLDDLTQLYDPRYNMADSSVHFCDTYTYNWLNKLSGFFLNNVGLGAIGSSYVFRGDFSFQERANLAGVEVSRIATPAGTINLIRDHHLDGTGVKIVGVNMANVKMRPLVGNGVNRDTTIYPGVQTIENTGVDKRVDLILTELGMEFTVPESFSVWV